MLRRVPKDVRTDTGVAVVFHLDGRVDSTEEGKLPGGCVLRAGGSQPDFKSKVLIKYRN